MDHYFKSNVGNSFDVNYSILYALCQGKLSLSTRLMIQRIH